MSTAPIGGASIAPWQISSANDGQRVAASLLPDGQLDPASLGDGLAMLLAIRNQQTRGQAAQGKADIDRKQGEQHKKLEEAKEAFKKWQDAQNGCHFFDGLFKVLSIAAAAFTAVTSLGAGSAGLALALSSGGFISKETGMFGPDASGPIGDFMKAVGGVLTGEMWITLAETTSGAGGCVLATHDEKLKDFGKGLAYAGEILQSAAVMGTLANEEGLEKAIQTTQEGGSIIENGVREGNMLHAQADSTQIKNEMKRLERFVEALIEGVKEIKESEKHATDAVVGAMGVVSKAAVMVAGGTRV